MRSIPSVLRHSRRAAAAALGLLLALAAPAAAQTVVDRCTTDRDPGGVNLAQALAAGGRITFDCPDPATIQITSLHRITRSIDIDGGGTITLDGAGTSAFLEAGSAGLTVQLAGLTVQRMAAPTSGAVIKSLLPIRVEIAGSRFVDNLGVTDIEGGQLDVEASRFERNRGPALKAADIAMRHSALRETDGEPLFSVLGSVAVSDSEVTGNKGGSVFRRCATAVLSRVLFRDNLQPMDGARDGGGAFSTDCNTSLENVTFEGNVSASNGGAVFARGQGDITVRGSRFIANRATLDGGAIAVEGAVVRQKVMLRYSVFRGNAARSGGAIWIPAGIAGGQAELAGLGVTFTGNAAAERGGAVLSDGVVVGLNRSAFIRNAAPAGAGVWGRAPAGATLGFANTLFVLNAGTAFQGGPARFANATILGSAGFGIAQDPPGPASRIFLANTIVENNAQGNCQGDPASLVDEGGNLQFPAGSCGATISQIAASLDTFYAPILGGAARGNGRDAICAGPLVGRRDFYGKRRPEADHCSIGAVEGDLDRTIAMVKGSRLPPPGGAGGTGAGDSAGGSCEPGAVTSCECRDLPVPRGSARGTADAERRLTGLAAQGIDFSVPEVELLSWLDTPDFTPYPAIADALAGLLGSRSLRCPVFIDVIVSNYERTPGVTSPRRQEDVRLDVLLAAVAEGYRIRHDVSHSDLAGLTGGQMCLVGESSPACALPVCDPDTPYTLRLPRPGMTGPEQVLAALSAVGIDFSVDETELRSWLDTPDFTPYPALAQALLNLTRNRPLRCPVFIDVVAFNYESTPGVSSPRALEDVRPDVLDAALLEGYNKRHGTDFKELEQLLR